MKLGTGVMRLYHENGRLKLEKHYAGNLEHKKGQFVGDSIAFHRNGMLSLAGVFSKAGRLHGPLIYFDEKGSLERAVFYVQGVKVSKEEYVKARAKYPELPPIPKSWKEWKKQIMRKCQAIVDGYRSMLPISLPPKL